MLLVSRKPTLIVDSIKVRVVSRLLDVTVELQNDKRSLAVLKVSEVS